MTEKQANYIEVLTKQRIYEYNHTLVQAYRSGFDLSSIDASNLINYLLGCEEKSNEDMLLKNTRQKLYKVINRKKSKKNQALLAELKKVTGFDFWNKTQTNLVNAENVAIIAEILK